MVKEKKIKYSLKWKWKNFDFDAHWRYINALFVFGKSKNRFVSNRFYTKILYIVHDEYLRHGKRLDVNDCCIDYFIRRAKGSENDAVIVSKDDYQKIPWNRQCLIPIIQTAIIQRFKTTKLNNITVCTYANIYYSKNLPWQIKARLLKFYPRLTSGGMVRVAVLSGGTKIILHRTGIIIFQNFGLEGYNLKVEGQFLQNIL